MKIDWFRANEKTLVSIQSPYGYSFQIRKNGPFYTVVTSTIHTTRVRATCKTLEEAKTEVEILLAEVMRKNGK